jgi:D-serine deaminase-like pyridoxal phosphate-dependent protein
MKILNEADIPSPALLIFRDVAEANIRRMLEIAGGPERLWPHVKTHKLEPLVKMQLNLGISKFKCATVAEAEMCAKAGASAVLLAMQPVGPAVQRLTALIQRYPQTAFSTIADAEAPVRALGEAAQKSAIKISVLLDVDCGMGRTGIAPGEKAARLYQILAATPGLRAAGLHAYDGHMHESDPAVRKEQCDGAFASVLELREKLRKMGLEVPRLVAGGTPSFSIHARYPDRELSPGTCVLWDFGYGDRFQDLPFQQAAFLLTRVVSKPGAGKLCLDLGHKAVAAENPHPRVRFPVLPDAQAILQSEEHLVIETAQAGALEAGQCLYGIPRHVCPTVALYNEAWAVDSGVARECWTVTARGRRISV